jgi:hypothetical protein
MRMCPTSPLIPAKAIIQAAAKKRVPAFTGTSGAAVRRSGGGVPVFGFRLSGKRACPRRHWRHDAQRGIQPAELKPQLEIAKLRTKPQSGRVGGKSSAAIFKQMDSL